MKTYQSPLTTRYGSQDMRALFSDYHKFTTWRKVWLALAKAQQQLGLDISDQQIAQLEQYVNDLNMDVAKEYEEVLFHDVMAHLHAYGDQAIDAKKILHLGATSAFVSDNAEILIQKEAMAYILKKLMYVCDALIARIKETAETTIVGFTHYQVAQPTTLGKRLAMYLQDFASDLSQVDRWFNDVKLRGVKGTTGTAASFLKLFEYNENKVFELDHLFAQSLQFKETFPITGQTYPRKFDSFTLFILSGIASSAHKLAVDFRLMQHDLLISEPFAKHQVGSSAMAYKRNPILSEKITGLARKVMVDALNGPLTASNQWLERSLDDSSNRRFVISESFLLVDEILNSLTKLVKGFAIDTQAIDQQLSQNMHLLISEPLLMAITKKGLDRQVWHEHIRVAFLDSLSNKETTLLSALMAIEDFPLNEEEINECISIKSISGVASLQAMRYVGVIEQSLKERKHD